jgi:hypothetical protein
MTSSGTSSGGWTDPTHGSWEELAVGQAVGALEPEDEEAFALHLRGCALCERLLIETECSAAELAYAPTQLPAPDRLRRKVASIAGTESRSAVIPGVVRRVPRATRLPRPTWGRPWIAVAFGVVVVVALSLWNLVLQSDNAAKEHSLKKVHAVIQCIDDPACTQIRLTKRTDATPRGLVLVQGEQATVVADGIEPNARGSTVYVLWQQARDAPQDWVAVGAFDVTCRTVCVIELEKKLRIPLAKTQTFWISPEATPSGWTQPSTPTATGQVPATTS